MLSVPGATIGATFGATLDTEYGAEFGDFGDFGSEFGANLSALVWAGFGLSIAATPPSISPDRIEALMPSQSYSEACSGTHYSAECSVCMSDLDPDAHVRVLPCKHVFHMNCIDTWFARSVFCPNCKGVVCAQEGW